MPLLASATTRREALLGRLARARALTDSILRTIRPGGLLERPIPERHRPIFYLGHLEAFDWNLIGRGGFGVPAFEPAFDRLFAFGIDPTTGGLPDDAPGDWPGETAVAAYNERVRAILDDLLLGARPGRPESPELADGTLLEVAIEHRLMHAETLCYLIRYLPPALKRGAADPPPPLGRPGRRQVEIPTGRITLGRPAGRGEFGWDNEFGEAIVELPAFRIDAVDVTNGEYLEFVLGGGYDDRSLWTPADWDWKCRLGLEHPASWVQRHGRFLFRGAFAEQPLRLDAPVWVSQAEAAAFARAEGRALPTEAELHRAAYGHPLGEPLERRAHPWGETFPSPAHGNFDFDRWDPVPVGAYPRGDSAFGVADLVGNGWEWTRTPFRPFPGFAPFAFYPGYSAEFFDEGHFVLFGAGPRTDAELLRRTFRNWFQPRYPYADTSFRLVEDDSC